jgi:hypothetical protein
MATPIKVENAHKIPGAILFMTITFKEGTTLTFKEGTQSGTVKIEKGKQDMNIVAYDPKFSKDETLEAVKTRYFNVTFPYFERFSMPGGPPALFQASGTYFGK